MKKGIIYTCITGRYDELLDHTYIDPRWEYVCFTDDLTLKNKDNFLWQIKPLVFDELDHIRNQRWHKLHPHILFPKYKRSVWVDANMNILKKDIYEDIDRAINKKSKMSMAPHPVRNCLYDEFLVCIDLGKDNRNVIEKQLQLIKEDGFPNKQGLYETGIIYREHHDKQVISVMNDWWWFIKNYSRRDQLSLTYVLWKHKINLDRLTDISFRFKNAIEIIYNEKHITKEELINQRNRLEEIIRQKEQEISNLLNSWSWWITRPLRRMKYLLNKFRR
jgi:hypothetical protein